MAAGGAHAPLLVRRVPPNKNNISAAFKDRPLTVFLVFVVTFLHFIAAASGLTSSEILLEFKGSLSNASALSSWGGKTSPCEGDDSNWAGVLCAEGNIYGLQLENMGLSGKINVETLKKLPKLRTISLMNNSFDGPLPEFKKLVSLRSIYLSSNRFSGEVPGDAFQGMRKLKKVYLSQNELKGPIPSSLASLPKLMDLALAGNQFTGQLPNFKQNFASFNVSNNALEGPLPASLSKLDKSSFSGNKGLCGEPLSRCDSPKETPSAPPTPEPTAGDPSSTDRDSTAGRPSSTDDSSSNNKKPSPSTASVVIVGIVVGIALAAIIAAAFILVWRKKRGASSTSVEAPSTSPSNFQKKSGFKEVDQRSSSSSSSSHGSPGRIGVGGGGKKKAEGASSKLSFVREDREKFDLPDLLKASAEILGSGCFGSSYKAALSTTGPVMVVKRYKQMNNVGREEFQEHMRRIGRLSHPNLLPLVAYYYRKEEKLLVSDYVEKGSLAVHLHGHQSLGQPSLDWPSRLKIAKGVARGLGYLQKELPSIIAAHGHLKSSNVLLGESNEPFLTDYGLVPVINQENAHELVVAYKSPEYLQHGRITKKTDVWSLGVLILEILTAKLPANFLQQRKGNEEQDLATWVNSVPREEWTTAVFDKEIVRSNNNEEGEMLKLLEIGLNCCEGNVEKRLELREAIERIEELKDKDHGDGDIHSSKGMADDFNTV